MSASENLRPMSSFYRELPALLYDELNDQVFEWTPERIAKDYNAVGATSDITWLEAWQLCSRVHDHRLGIIEWDGLLIAGWTPLVHDA